MGIFGLEPIFIPIANFPPIPTFQLSTCKMGKNFCLSEILTTDRTSYLVEDTGNV